LQGLGYPLQCRPVRFARRGGGLVLIGIALTLLIARFAVDAMLKTMSTQLHFEDALGQVASGVTTVGVLMLGIGIVLLAWAQLTD
jgi:hypothetical protein